MKNISLFLVTIAISITFILVSSVAMSDPEVGQDIHGNVWCIKDGYLYHIGTYNQPKSDISISEAGRDQYGNVYYIEDGRLYRIVK